MTKMVRYRIYGDARNPKVSQAATAQELAAISPLFLVVDTKDFVIRGATLNWETAEQMAEELNAT